MNLDKVLHIFYIYVESSNEVWHCEKRKVIYYNSEWLYVKSGRKTQLEEIHINCKWNGLQEKFDKLNPSRGWFLNVEEFNSKEINSIIQEKKRASELKSAEIEFNSAKTRYEKATERIKNLKNTK